MLTPPSEPDPLADLTGLSEQTRKRLAEVLPFWPQQGRVEGRVCRDGQWRVCLRVRVQCNDGRQKHVNVALTYIYGIGKRSAMAICKEAQINPDNRMKSLTEDEIGRMAAIIDGNGVEGRKVAPQPARQVSAVLYEGRVLQQPRKPPPRCG